jgi:hypothetical protein
VVTPEVRAAVDATGRKKLIMAGLVTEVCLARSVLALGLPETPIRLKAKKAALDRLDGSTKRTSIKRAK